MTWSVVWTLLPNGFDPVSRRARLSLVASPRNAGPGTTLGASPLARWPSIVAGLGPLKVIANPSSELIPATVVSPPPDQALWDILFPPTTPVETYKDDASLPAGQGGGSTRGAAAGGTGGASGARLFDAVESSHAHGAAAAALAGLYEQALRTSPTELLSRDHPVAQTIAGLSAWAAAPDATPGTDDSVMRAQPGGAVEASARAAQQPNVAALLDPGVLSNARIEQAAQILRQQGHAGVAAAAPLAPVLRRLRLTSAPPAPPRAQSNGVAGDHAAPPPPIGTKPSLPGGTGTGTGSGSGPGPGSPPAPPSLVSGIRPVEQADFHQVVGMILDHPTLALRLGLRIDLTIASFSGERSIRVVDAGGQPLNGPVPVTQPFSRVVSDPVSGRFVMATEPLAVSEVVNGMLDLRSATTLTPGRSVVSDLDVVGLTEQLHVLSGSMVARSAAISPTAPSNGTAASAVEGAPESAIGGAGAAPAGIGTGIALPPRRDVGFTVSQVDRLAGAVGKSLARSASFQQAVARAAGPAGTAGAVPPDLFSDDATSGYRVDVSMDGGPFRSLMRRHMVYRIGASKAPGSVAIEAHDEGLVDPVIPVQQYDRSGNPHLLVGEELFGWENWSLASPRPGPKVVAETAGGPTVAMVEPGPAPGYPLTMQNRVEPGTLPRLRYGRSYRFRARAVDLAGNSIDPALCDPAYVTSAVTYRRHEPVHIPVIVLRRRCVAGESLLRLVVWSDGDGTVLGGPSERHIAPPKGPQHLAELHGLFDEAIGPDSASRAPARSRQLDIARREAGSFLDPRVPNPNGGADLVPAPGIAITTNDPVKRPPVSKLPIPRGLGLRNGEYVVHDTPSVICPYTPDPAAAGAAFAGLPGATGVVTVDYGSRAWPFAQPFRLEVRATTTANGSASVVADAAGKKVLGVAVPPAAVVKVQLSSTITPAALAVMDAIDPAQRQNALDGQVRIFSPRQEMILVHAVRRPLAAAPLTLFFAQTNEHGTYWPRNQGDTRVRLHGMIQPHAASAARVDLVAAWDEVVDRPGRPVVTESRRETLTSFDVAPGANVVGFGNAPSPFPLPGVQFPTAHQAVEQVLGDQKHRLVSYSATSATRFREYFLGLSDDDPSLVREGPAQTIHILNARRPDPLAVHSMLPMFKWSRKVQAGRYVSVRETAGLRVYLRRPYHTTGVAERLGVLVYDSPAAGDAAVGRNDPVCRLISRWGQDPLEREPDQAMPHLTSESFPARKEVIKTMALLEMGRTRPPAAYGVTVVGHEVQFDAERDLWYADVEVNVPNQRFTFLRLGLVRFQPMSAQGSHVSRVELPDPVQLLPKRTLSAVTGGPSGERLEVIVRGPALGNTTYTAEHHRRALDATLEPRLDITEPTASGLTSMTHGPRSSYLEAVVSGVLVAPLQPVPGGTSAIPPEYARGRVVVRELQNGRDILSGESEQRVVYFETFDRDLPPNPTLSASPATVVSGGKVTVTWSKATGSTAKDWIGLYAPGATNQEYKMYLYTDGAAAGSLDFVVGVPPGTYVFRFLPSNDYDHTATSSSITVTSPPIPPTGTTRVARTGQPSGRGTQGQTPATPGEL